MPPKTQPEYDRVGLEIKNLVVSRGAFYQNSASDYSRTGEQ